MDGKVLRFRARCVPRNSTDPVRDGFARHQPEMVDSDGDTDYVVLYDLGSDTVGVVEIVTYDTDSNRPSFLLSRWCLCVCACVRTVVVIIV